MMTRSCLSKTLSSIDFEAANLNLDNDKPVRLREEENLNMMKQDGIKLESGTQGGAELSSSIKRKDKRKDSDDFYKSDSRDFLERKNELESKDYDTGRVTVTDMMDKYKNLSNDQLHALLYYQEQQLISMKKNMDLLKCENAVLKEENATLKKNETQTATKVVSSSRRSESVSHSQQEAAPVPLSKAQQDQIVATTMFIKTSFHTYHHHFGIISRVPEIVFKTPQNIRFDDDFMGILR